MRERDFITVRISTFLNPVFYLPLIYASISFPMMGLSRDRLTGEQLGSVDFRYALALYLVFTLAALRKVAFRKLSPLPLQAGDQFFFLFVIIIFIQAMVLQNPMILGNLALMLSISFSLRCASKQEGFVRSLSISSLVLVAFLITARIVFGPPEGRWLGGIHPNNLSGPALVATILAMFGSRRIFDIGTAISLGMAILVSSRYAIVAITFTYGSFWLINMRHAGKLRLCILVIGIIVLVFYELLSTGSGFISELLELNSASRGLGSGLSGREGQWANFLPQVAERPLFGYGFRDRSVYYGAHNGFLNLILENGVLGGTVFLLFFLSRLRQAFRQMAMTPKSQARGHWLVAYVALIIGAMLQPQLINFGDVLGITALMLLFSSMRSTAGESALASRHMRRNRLSMIR